MRTQTPIEVDEGEIEVTGRTADVVHRYERLALLEVDLGSKWAVIAATGNVCGMVPMMILQATDRTLNVNEQHRYIGTAVHFPAWTGWTIAVASVSRYTLVVCLTKREEDRDENA